MPDPTNTIEFWTVWNPQGRASIVRHPSVERADTEAKRLANLHPGQSFYVMKAVSVARGVETRTVNVASVATHPADNRTDWEKALDREEFVFKAASPISYTARKTVGGWNISWRAPINNSFHQQLYHDAEVHRMLASGYWKPVK